MEGLKQFVDQLTSDLGMIEPLAPNEDQSYSLLLDPDLRITIREDSQLGVISFFTKLVECPSKKIEDYFMKVMAANLFGHETGGGVLGLDKEGRNVVFSYLLSGPMDYKRFRNTLEDFANYADAWREETVKFEMES